MKNTPTILSGLAVIVSLIALYSSGTQKPPPAAAPQPSFTPDLGTLVAEANGGFEPEIEREPWQHPDVGSGQDEPFVPLSSRKGLQEARDAGTPIFTVSDVTPYDVRLVLFASLTGDGTGRFFASVEQPSGRFTLDLPQGDYYVVPGASGPFEDMFFVQDYPVVEVNNDHPTLVWKEPRARSKPTPRCDLPFADPTLCP